jgi:hypothetical protein
MPNDTTAWYEAALARAGRALSSAYSAAEKNNDLGAMEDTASLHGEVTRLMRASIDGKKRKPSRVPGEMTIDDFLDPTAVSASNRKS